MARIVLAFIRAFSATWRYRIEGWDEVEKLPGGKIICGWHGKSLPFATSFRNRGIYVIISLSRDGEVQARIFAKLGYQIIRGSTGKGGERALVESIRVLKNGATMAITPDGPQGPIGVVQGGVMLMAKKSGAALVPIGIAARPRKRLMKAWDKYMIPLPFARIRLFYGEPLCVPADATNEQVEELRLEFERRINAMDARAAAALGLGDNPPV